MSKLYVRFNPNTENTGLQFEVVNITNDRICVIDISGKHIELRKSDVLFYCDSKGHDIETFADKCSKAFKSINQIDNEFHMFDVCDVDCNKNKFVLDCKNSDFVFVMSTNLTTGQKYVQIIDSNHITKSFYEVIGEYKFIHLLRKHIIETQHTIFLNTEQIKKKL